MSGTLLPETDLALEQCRAHFADYRANAGAELEPQIVAYLTRHVAVLMCGEIERVITRLLHERIDSSGDPGMSRLVKSIRGNLLRNARFSEIGDKLAKVGPECKAMFEAEAHEAVGEPGINRLGATVRNRDEAAHSVPPDITFGELEAAFAAANSIVLAAKNALEASNVA